MNTPGIFLKIKALAFLSLLVVTKLFAYTVIEEVATKAGGYDIPILIYLPDDKSVNHPVQFNVHGGGWNGGTAKAVPAASMKAEADILCDRLGVVYVGLAYRCKGNNGTFKLAVEDLEASVKWFMDRADQFNADTSRIGFSGGSAGTTLASTLAQRYPNCKAYYGTEGMYNLVVKDGSNFPNVESRADFGLSKPEEELYASAYYNLRSNPPSALLFHGKDDWLCDYSQSVNFAEKINASGGNARVILYERINHTCMSLSYPGPYINTIYEVSKFLTNEFGLTGIDTLDILAKLESKVERYYPFSPVPVNSILGTWAFKKDTISFEPNGVCSVYDTNRKRIVSASYTVVSSKIAVVYNEMEKEFFYRKDNAVCEMKLTDDRNISRVYKYNKISSYTDVVEFNNSSKRSNDQITVYPNPLYQNTLSIDLANLNDKGNVNIRIAKLNGQVVYKQTFYRREEIVIDTDGLLNASIYLITVTSENSSTHRKLIVR